MQSKGKKIQQGTIAKKQRREQSPSKSSKSSANSFEKTLDVLTSEAIKNSGGANVLQAQYYKEVASAVMNSSSPTLYFAKPSVSNKQTEEWQQSFLYVIKFLKKHGMTNTLEAMQLESPKIGKNLRGNKCKFVFDELIGTSDDLGDRPFRYRVDSFFEENGLELPPNPYAYNTNEEVPDVDIQTRGQTNAKYNIIKPILKEKKKIN